MDLSSLFICTKQNILRINIEFCPLEIVFIVVLLGLVIAYSALVTNTLEGFPKFQYTAGVSGLLVASVVLVAAEFIQRLVFRFLEKKKSSPSESEEISEEKESGEF